jgi:hypothetical protein
MFKKQTKATLMGVKKRLQKHPGTQQSTLPWKQCIFKQKKMTFTLQSPKHWKKHAN